MSGVEIKVLLGIVHDSEDVQIRRFPMVGVCPRVSKDVQSILNVKQTFLF